MAWVEAKADDSIESIAYRHGHHPDTVWNHPQNSALRDKRGSMHVLLRGDRVFVPDLRKKTLALPTGQRHALRRHAVPAVLRLRIVIFGRPVRQRPCRVCFPAHDELRLETDDEGFVEIPLYPDAEAGRLVAELEDGTSLEFAIRPRRLDPVTTMTGVQARLSNLGFYQGEIDGLLNLNTLFALQNFQRACGLAVTGSVDEPTRAALLRDHGT